MKQNFHLFLDNKFRFHSRAQSRLLCLLLFPPVDDLPRAHQEYGARQDAVGAKEEGTRRAEVVADCETSRVEIEVNKTLN